MAAWGSVLRRILSLHMRSARKESHGPARLPGVPQVRKGATTARLPGLCQLWCDYGFGEMWGDRKGVGLGLILNLPLTAQRECTCPTE